MMIRDTTACAARFGGGHSLRGGGEEREGVDQATFFVLMRNSVWY